jgi:hypothetical protein
MAKGAFIQLTEQNTKDTIKLNDYHSHNQCICLASISCYEDGPYLSMLRGLKRTNKYDSHNQCIRLASISCYEEDPYLSMLCGLKRSNKWKVNFFTTSKTVWNSVTTIHTLILKLLWIGTEEKVRKKIKRLVNSQFFLSLLFPSSFPNFITFLLKTVYLFCNIHQLP